MPSAELAPLTTIAIAAVGDALRTGERRLPALHDLPPALAAAGAAFVTLERDGDLLGCIGTLTPDGPLGISVAHSALGAAFDDPRMPEITRDDFDVMSVKVSVLSPLRPREVGSYAALVESLEPNVDGLVIERRSRRATFLPSVWDSLPDPEAFAAALWRKAGLAPGLWDAHVRVQTYTTVELVDPGPRSLVA